MILRRAFALGLLCVAVSLIGSCHLAVGADDYRSVAKQVCGCPGVATFFSDCEDRVNEALAAASDDDAREWLDNFDSLSCGDCEVGLQLSCLQVEPVCRQSNEACKGPLDCCGASDGSGYCHAGLCARDTLTCRESFEVCSTNEECCGFDAGVSACIDNDGKGNICLETCSDGQANCPGCCTGVTVPEVPELTSLCLGAKEPVTDIVPLGQQACQVACISGIDVEGCAEDTSCVTISLAELGTIDLCQAPTDQ